ncbi:M16 family metallopeptidase [Bacillaceae bacterium W0354]
MVKKHVLNNGVRIVEEHFPYVHSVSIGIWILAGSRNENKNYQGISHLIEHMLFKGTESRSAKDIAETFDAIGGQTNAFTSKEYTCVYARVIDQHAPHAFDLLADMFFNSTFDTEELEREKKVILEEITMTEDTPDDIIFDYLHEASFKDHPLASPILGSKDTLNAFTREDIIQYMDQYYTTDRIVISVAGNIKKELIDQIKDVFSAMPKQQSQPDVLYETFHDNKIEISKETAQAHLSLGYKGLPIGERSLYPLLVLNNVLGGSMSSRLFQVIREEKGLTYAIFSYHSAFRDNGLLTIYGATSPNQIDYMNEEILKIIRELKNNGITDKELNNTIQQIKGQLVLGLENPSSRMHRNGRNELLNQPNLTIDELIKKIDEVKHHQIKEIADYLLNIEPAKALILPKNV